MIGIDEIEAARERSRRHRRTHAARASSRSSAVERRIYCKLETLQPINSFKLRGAANAVLSAPPEAYAEGLVTASAGNMAQGVAWMARELGVPATIAVPEHAPEAKLSAIAALGGRAIKVPYDDWWQTIVTGQVEGVAGLFVHPVDDEGVMAGNGTIGLEIVEDLPDVDTVAIPVGGGGLATGIASAIRARRPQTRIVTVEPDTGAALRAALAAGEPTDVELHAVGGRRLRQQTRARPDVASPRPARRPRQSPFRSRRCSPRFGCWRGDCASSPKARGRCRPPPR